MNAINVLSDTLKAGGGSNKNSSIKGENATDSLENGIVDFAGILSGLKSIKADPIGQNSKIGQDLEEGQNPDRYGQNLGYGHFALSFLSQPIVLGDLPTGKEASFGNGVNQGTGEGLSTDDMQSIVALTKLSLDTNEALLTKGIMSQMPQGNNPEISELDKYKQIIADLLGALSGKVPDLSAKDASGTDGFPKGVSFDLERGIIERQGMMKFELLDSNEEFSAKGITSQISQGTNSEVKGFNNYRQIIADLLVALSGQITNSSPKGDIITGLSPEVGSLILERGTSERQEIAKLAQGWLSVTEDVLNNAQVARAQHTEGLILNGQATDKIMNYNDLTEAHANPIQTVIRPMIDFLAMQQETGSREVNTKVSSLLLALNQILSQAQQANVHQGVIKEMPQGVVQGATIEETAKGYISESSETFEIKASQNPNQNLGLGSVGNIVTGNVADGKTVAIPVWEQISNAFRQQFTSQHQELKDLDIRLHPAELGRIQIGMRWENGQVHLLVHASEATTGQLLQNQLLELRQMLTNQGINCGTLQMGQQSRNQQQNSQEDEARRRALDQNTNLSEDEEVILGINPFSHGRDGNIRINVTA